MLNHLKMRERTKKYALSYQEICAYPHYKVRAFLLGKIDAYDGISIVALVIS
jgi:hypothetical protein